MQFLVKLYFNYISLCMASQLLLSPPTHNNPQPIARTSTGSPRPQPSYNLLAPWAIAVENTSNSRVQENQNNARFSQFSSEDTSSLNNEIDDKYKEIEKLIKVTFDNLNKIEKNSKFRNNEKLELLQKNSTGQSIVDWFASPYNQSFFEEVEPSEQLKLLSFSFQYPFMQLSTNIQQGIIKEAPHIYINLFRQVPNSLEKLFPQNLTMTLIELFSHLITKNPIAKKNLKWFRDNWEMLLPSNIPDQLVRDENEIQTLFLEQTSRLIELGTDLLNLRFTTQPVVNFKRNIFGWLNKHFDLLVSQYPKLEQKDKSYFLYPLPRHIVNLVNLCSQHRDVIRRDHFSYLEIEPLRDNLVLWIKSQFDSETYPLYKIIYLFEYKKFKIQNFENWIETHTQDFKDLMNTLLNLPNKIDSTVANSQYLKNYYIDLGTQYLTSLLECSDRAVKGCCENDREFASKLRAHCPIGWQNWLSKHTKWLRMMARKDPEWLGLK